MELSLRQIARVLNGEISGNQVLAPALGHSPKDRGLSVKLAATRYGYISYVHTAGATESDQIANREMVREKLGIPKNEPRPSDADLSKLINDAVASQKKLHPKPKPEAIYRYQEQNGTLLYEVLRCPGKKFMHRLPNGTLKGSERRVIYRWPELLKYPHATIFICEGEKDTDRVASLDLCATTVASGKWTDDCVNALAGRDCWILADNDAAGEKKALEIAERLYPIAKSVKVVRLPGLPDRGDVSDWLDMGHTKQEFEDVCYEALEWHPEIVTPKNKQNETAVSNSVHAPVRETGKELIPQHLFPLVRVSDLIADRTEDEDLIDQLLPRIGLAAIWGPPKSGKSFWALDVAMHVALGWRYRDRFVQQGTVVYLALEGQRGMRKRVLAFVKHHFSDGVPVIPFRLVLVPVKLTTHAKSLIEEIQFELRDEIPKLVVVDTLARAILGDENNPKDMGAFIAAADRIQHAFNCCVLVVHHSGWTGDHSRGSSALPAALDVELSCSRASNDAPVVVKIEKAKDMAEDAEIISTLQRVDTGKTNRAGKSITSMVLMPANPGTVVRKRRFSPDIELAYDAIIDAINERGEPVKHRKIPPTARTISMSEGMSVFEQKDTKSDTLTDSRRTAFRRAVRALAKQKIIGFEKPYIWVVNDEGQNQQSGQF